MSAWFDLLLVILSGFGAFGFLVLTIVGAIG